MSLNFESFHKTFKNNPEQLNEFLINIILKRLNLEIPFETKYQSLIDKSLLLDYIVVSDAILNYSMKFLGRNSVSLEEYQNEFPFAIDDISFISNLYHFTLINYEKLNILKAKEITHFQPNSLIGFNVNMQVTFSHQNYGILDEPSALIQLFTNTNNNISNNYIELNERELDNFIQKLKEINKKIL